MDNDNNIESGKMRAVNEFNFAVGKRSTSLEGVRAELYSRLVEEISKAHDYIAYLNQQVTAQRGELNMGEGGTVQALNDGGLQLDEERFTPNENLLSELQEFHTSRSSLIEELVTEISHVESYRDTLQQELDSLRGSDAPVAHGRQVLRAGTQVRG